MVMINFKEPELYKLFENHISEALELLRTENQINEKIIINDGETHDVWFVILHHFQSFKDLKSFKAITTWLDQNQWYGNHFTCIIGFGTVYHPVALDDILRRIIHEHILDCGLEFNHHKIKQWYDSLEKFLISKNIEYRVNIYLSGWDSTIKFKIDDGLEIHGLDVNNARSYNKGSKYYQPHIDGIVVYGTSFPKKFLPTFDDTKENNQIVGKSKHYGAELIQALRVFKSGKFGAVAIREYSPFLTDFKSNLEGYEIKRERFSMSNKGYVIDLKQIEEFKKFWKMYKTIKEKKNFLFVSLALSQFMRTYERNDKIDPVIDLWISFEYLFTRKDENSKILKKRIVKFLEPENIKEQEKLRRFLDVAYDLRNDIVHAGNNADFYLDGKKIPFWDITEELEDVLRQCIQKFVKLLFQSDSTKEHILYDLGVFQK